jgi:outer membrane protein assembly factor BamB
MSRTIICIPSSPDASAGRDLVYSERSSRARGLHVLMQDVSPRASTARARFLQAAYRDVVARYLAVDRLATPAVFMRDTVRSFDAIARHVDTRLDDLGELGIFVLLRDADAVYLLCARSAAPRMRVHGVFVPLATAGLDGVRELSIETTRAQHDLFAQSLPETLAIYRIARAGEAGERGREILLGGSSDDVAAAVEAIDLHHPRDAGTLDVERLRHTVLCIAFEGLARRRGADASRPEPVQRSIRFGARAGLLAAVVVVAGAALALYATKPWRSPAPDGARSGRATLERAPARETRRTEVETGSRPDLEALTREGAETTKRGFSLAWEKAYRGAVTSSPIAVDATVVFGARDGRVYAIDRSSGDPSWTHAAAGGVGASPVAQGEAVIVADYGGNVYRLRRSDGAVVWKRALGQKIVSTPAVTRERVVVGTVQGRVVAVSFDTGRVLWKFAARGQVRGAIAHAGETFLIPSHDGRLYAIAEDTGARRWAVALGGAASSSPASDGDIVVIGTARGEVLALDLARGAKRWSYSVGATVNSALALADGRVYSGAGDGRLYCIDAGSGELKWRFDTGGVILSRPFVGDGKVVVTSYDGSVYCLDAATGEPIDRFVTGEAIFSSPLVVDGRVFFGNNAGRFYCLEAPRS